MKYFILIISLLAALLAQALGYLTTCTQGANGTFLSGCLFSAPFIFISFIILMRDTRNDETKLLVYIISFFIMALLIWMNVDAVYEIFVYGGSPCGEDYRGSASYNHRNIIIGIFYGALPLLLMFLLAKGIRRAWNVKRVPAA